MINKRLISLGDKKPIYKVVACKLAAMLLNTAMIFSLADGLQKLYIGEFTAKNLSLMAMIFLAVAVLRGFLKLISARESHKATCQIKLKLRTLLYEKQLGLGSSYAKKVSTAEILQVSTEGVDQLETYFGLYLPQFFYCMIAPVILFIIVAQIDFMSAFVLFICVPLIPISIVVIQKIAKKLLAKYWGLYAALGDNFLENVQGMTTLKIYEADEKYHQDMNKAAEHFRLVTMKVLSMQLNSIIVMDTVAYGGAALGGILAITALMNAKISLMGAMIIILLASEFFLPMRSLGSLFHIAMNGMAAADKIFSILDLEVSEDGQLGIRSEELGIRAQDLYFSYTADKAVLKGVNFTANTGITALVGTSGCGKSTIASLLCLKEQAYEGSIKISGIELAEISKKSLHSALTRVADQGYIFSGTLRENLLMADEKATDEAMISVLKKVKLWDFLQTQEGLDTVLAERGTNFSGGQRQRLNLARALLCDSEIYIFDEITSNIDVESEDAIMSVILDMAKEKIIILISHRLANVVKAEQILLLKDGKIKERGKHLDLMELEGDYAKLFNEQKLLETYGKGAN